MKYVLCRQNSSSCMVCCTDNVVICWNYTSFSSLCFIISVAGSTGIDVDSAVTLYEVMHSPNPNVGYFWCDIWSPGFVYIVCIFHNSNQEQWEHQVLNNTPVPYKMEVLQRTAFFHWPDEAVLVGWWKLVVQMSLFCFKRTYQNIWYSTTCTSNRMRNRRQFIKTAILY